MHKSSSSSGTINNREITGKRKKKYIQNIDINVAYRDYIMCALTCNLCCAVATVNNFVFSHKIKVSTRRGLYFLDAKMGVVIEACMVLHA